MIVTNAELALIEWIEKPRRGKQGTDYPRSRSNNAYATDLVGGEVERDRSIVASPNGVAASASITFHFLC